MKTLKLLVVVPWWKYPRLSKLKQRDDIMLTHPYGALPGNKCQLVMMDRELQHEWDEFMDEWFYENLYPLAVDRSAFQWCSEIEKNAKTG